MPRTAFVLQDVAGRLAGRDPLAALREDPVAWAYGLRDGVALAEPALVVSHWDPALEAAALAAALADGGDWVDRVVDAAPLAETAPTAAAVELVGTLAGIYRGKAPVAALLSAPATVAAALAPTLLEDPTDDADLAELADLAADALAALLGAYAEAGATTIVVADPSPGAVALADAAASHRPLVRALAHHRLEGVLLAPREGERPEGYAAVAELWDGQGQPPEAAAGGAGTGSAGRSSAAGKVPLATPPASGTAPPAAPPAASAAPPSTPTDGQPPAALALALSVFTALPAEFAAAWPAIAAAAGDGLLLSAGPVPADAPPENLRATVEA